ncbi:YfjP family GTPase [Streptomyces sp. NPDC020667]|uniref:YfjP family GTPase n=1 Tax=Streptomyces sp. NPDC020667 TaxID=3154895 RepID=UPI0033DCAB67
MSDSRSDSREERHEKPAPEAARGTWDDGLIARRARPGRAPRPYAAPESPSAERAVDLEDGALPERARIPERPMYAPDPTPTPPIGAVLRPRLDALRELVGLSRARLDRRTLAEAGRVLEEAAARQRHSLDLTVVAIAGATGSGKSTLFNALARTQLSEAGVRRPTTAVPIACAWTDRADGAEGLLDRLGIPARARRQPVRPYDPGMHGLVLLDLPDHDSATTGHREQVDRLLRLVDAVIWVVDPEKYADAVLHERYLRPLAGYAEVTFVVLNQVDRLSEDAADQVLDDLRRLLDEDGLALGEHGEPGAVVLALSALTGAGVGELRETLTQFTAGRNVAERRLVADVDGVSARLRPAYVAKGRPGLTEAARQEFEDRLAEAVGAQAAGLAAERAWLRDADRACGTSWTLAHHWFGRKRGARKVARMKGSAQRTALGRAGERVSGSVFDTLAPPKAGDALGALAQLAASPCRTVSRPLVEQAVRALAYEASAGLPDPWAQAVREAAGRGAEGLADALDAAASEAAAMANRWTGRTGVGLRTRGPRTGVGGRHAKGGGPCTETRSAATASAPVNGSGRRRGAEEAGALVQAPVLPAQELTATELVSAGLAGTGRADAGGGAGDRSGTVGVTGGAGRLATPGTAAGKRARFPLPRFAAAAARPAKPARPARRSGSKRSGEPGSSRTRSGRVSTWRTRGGARPARPGWWAVAGVMQGALLGLQLAGAVWLMGLAAEVVGGEWWAPGLLLTGGGVGGPVLTWCCRMLARGPARRYGLETERRLRSAAAGCGRERVLEPVAAELLRYREVRAQFVIAAGGS